MMCAFTKDPWLPHAFYEDSLFIWKKEVISFLIFIVLAGGKTYAKNFSDRVSQVMIELGATKFNQLFALFQNWIGIREV